MAIEKPIQEITLKLKTEITSKLTKLYRRIAKNTEGVYQPLFPIEIDVESITYILNDNNDKVDMYEIKDLGNIALDESEISALWATPVTVNGQDTYLGVLLAAKIDEIIATKLNP